MASLRQLQDLLREELQKVIDSIGCNVGNALSGRVGSYSNSEVAGFFSNSVSQLINEKQRSFARVQVQGGDMQYMIGSDPTQDGVIVKDGETLVLSSLSEVTNLKFKGVGASTGKVVVMYYK